jgi:transposase
MHYLAFDVSRDTVDGVLVTRSLQVKERLQLPNTREAIQSALAQFRAAYPHLTVGVESTGAYHRAVVEACTNLQIECRLLNPILTKQVIRHSIRKRKTDREDALVVAKLLLQNEGKAVTTTDVVRPACTLARSGRKVGMLVQSLDLHLRHVTTVLGDDLPPALQDAKGALQRAQVLLYRTAVQQSPSDLVKLLTTIPGVGAKTAAVVLAETNNLSWCNSGDALIARAGLDPRIRQSGVSLNTTGRLTKRGSPYLRWILWCAANLAQRHDPELRAYYLRKRAEGKRHKVAVLAVSRKLAQRMVAVAKRGTPYVVRES